MKKLKGIVFVFTTNVVLVSCEESVHSVEWYQQHEAERKSMIERCNKNPDLIEKNKNCQNAGSAQFRSTNYTKSPSKAWRIEDGIRS